MACGLRFVGVSSPRKCCVFESKRAFGQCPSAIVNLRLGDTQSNVVGSLSFLDLKTSSNWSLEAPKRPQVYARGSICASKARKWWDWEKSIVPNMVEIKSAPQLVSALRFAGDRLVIVDFYSPGCGGCRALHPKICQLAESNPDAIFLKVNYEELKKMSQALHIHVLPFFRFYRGVDGEVCSFSCTNATIKKFKDALAKHGGDQLIVGPAKGLDQSELLKLASIGEISSDLVPIYNEENISDLMKDGFELSRVLTGAGRPGNGSLTKV